MNAIIDMKSKIQPRQQAKSVILPSQTGSFLVVCNADGTTTVHDANNYELVEKGLMEKFHRDWEAAASAVMQLYTTSFAQVNHRIHAQNNRLPVLLTSSST